uniref:cadherin-like domain-containing protein n=1 Tax=Oscillatoria salina TaxID=331517 RepID=UPI001CD02CB6
MTFNIEFDYRFDTNGFFDDAERRTTLEAAAQIWENLIDDEFDNVPAGIEITVRNPQTGEENQEVILDTEIDDLLIFVGTQSPPFGIGIDGDALARGGPRTTDGSDFEPFAGNISFDPTPSFNDGSSADWFFDQTPETDDDQPFGSIDFLETALHEIGHVLGIGTANIFSTIGEEGALFDGPNALSVNEGNPIPLENDLAHVLDGFTLRDGTQALMSPVDSSRVPTVVDLALLADIGYEVDLNLDNSPPVAVFDTATTTEGEAVEINVVENDTDSDGTLDLTSVTVATQPTNGTVAVDATTGVITYTPNAAFTGTDSFTYTVDDNEGETSNAATVEVTVDADVANVAPVATNDTATTAENTAIAIPVLDNDTDSDGTLDLTSVTVATQPTNGTVAVDATTGVITYTPNAEFTGSDTFTYTVDDNEGETSNAATVEVTVDADVANVAPVAINDTATTAENTAIAIPVLNNDTDSDGTLDLTSVAVATQPTNGTVSIDDTTGVITYTPNANFTGTDSFTYTVDDNEGETSNAATVEVTVDEDVANVAPVATNDTAT